jgi:hypothetical protein
MQTRKFAVSSATMRTNSRWSVRLFTSIPQDGAERVAGESKWFLSTSMSTASYDQIAAIYATKDQYLAGASL